MRILFTLNPWWENKEWEEKDKQLVEFEAMEIKWIPKWLNNVSINSISESVG